MGEMAITARPLGATGLTVTRMGIGMAALGRPGYINLNHATDLGRDYAVDEMREHAWSVLDAAWAAGIRYYDAARSYGRSEEFLGAWLRARGNRPDDLVVGSKWGYTYTAGWKVEASQHEVKDHTLPVLQRQWQESRNALGRYLKLYQVHSATFDSGVLTNAEVLRELVHLKMEGVVIGLTLSGVAQGATLRSAMNIVVDGVRVFDCVQATWNLLEQSAGAALAEAHAAGMGVLVKEALANGRLTLRNHEPAFVEQRNLLVQEASKLNTTVDGLALAAVLAQPWADIVLSGAATVDQLYSNVRAFEYPVDAAAAAALAPLVETPQVYWATRAALAWN
ncbi:MAG: aldo/keto reductase [Anaerolineales bacterium]|nr:aldo/keto reductase [Anaerolineales bacterium]